MLSMPLEAFDIDGAKQRPIASGGGYEIVHRSAARPWPW
jgi:hypothetical protein